MFFERSDEKGKNPARGEAQGFTYRREFSGRGVPVVCRFTL
jgi:hypothetical protein